MSAFEDTDNLPLLLRRLVDRVDPDRFLYRAESVGMSARLDGTLVRFLYPGAFDSGFRVEHKVHEAHAVFHNVPRRGDRVLIKGDTVYLFWRDRALQVIRGTRTSLKAVTDDVSMGILTSLPYALPGGAEMTRAFREVFVQQAGKRPKHLASVCYHFGTVTRFYVWMMHLLEDPETQVQRLPTDNAILDTLSGRFELGDRERCITLAVRYPEGTHAHSRLVHLVFDRETGLLHFMRYRVTNFRAKVYSWQRLERWSPFPGVNSIIPCSRRAVVLQGKFHREFGRELPYSMKFDATPLEVSSWLPPGRRFVSAASSARGEPGALAELPA